MCIKLNAYVVFVSGISLLAYREAKTMGGELTFVCRPCLATETITSDDNEIITSDDNEIITSRRWAGFLPNHPLTAKGGPASEAAGRQRRPSPGTFLCQARGSPEEVLGWVHWRHAPDVSLSAQSEQPLRPSTRQLSALAPYWLLSVYARTELFVFIFIVLLLLLLLLLLLFSSCLTFIMQ